LFVCAKHLFVAAILAGQRAAPFLKERDVITARDAVAAAAQ
jgi:hypothetical protein